MFYRVCKILVSSLFKLLFQIKAEGIVSFPKQGGVLLASNHVSYLDPPCVGVACPRRVYFVAREDLFENWILGLIIKLFDPIPLARSKGDLSATRAVAKRLRRGEVVCLFPEGTRSADGKLREGQLGIGFLAVKTGAPVIPVYINGTHKALPRGQHWIRPSPVRVFFGRSLDPHKIGQGLPVKERYRKITQCVMESLRGFESSKRNSLVKEES